MSHFDTVTVLDILTEDDLRQLQDYGLSYTPGEQKGRAATPLDLRRVLESFEDCVSTTGRWRDTWEADLYRGTQLNLNEKLLTIWAKPFEGNESAPLRYFSFRNSDVETLLLFTKRLSAVCGPLLVWSDSGGRPVIVTVHTDLEEAINIYDSE